MAFNVSEYPSNFSEENDLVEADTSHPETVEDLVRRPETLLMPILDGKKFFNGPDDHQPILVRTAGFPFLPDAAKSISLLGMVEDAPVFGLDLPPKLPEDLLSVGEFLELRPVLPDLDPEDIQLLGLARTLAHWHNTNGFCAVCGSPSESVQAGHMRVCTNPECGNEVFPRTDPAIIVLAEYEDRCLLGRQAGWKEGMYSPIAGFVEPCEDLESAVRRELMEETGIPAGKVTYMESQPWPLPASLMVAFRAEALDTDIRPGDDELEDVRWFNRRDILDGLEAGTLKLPNAISVSHKLIITWFNEAEGADLEQRIAP